MILSVPRRGELLAKIPVFCRVEPLKRPRTVYNARGLIYQPLDNQRVLRAALATYNAFRFDQVVIVDTTVNFQRAKSSKFTYPCGKLHGDEDNLRKALNDALVAAGILKDDSLIMGGTNYKLFGDEDMALIEIWSIDESVVIRDVV